MFSGAITDVAGIRVGHATDLRALTGCTVVLYEEGATAGGRVRGWAPGTRETDALAPERATARWTAARTSSRSGAGAPSDRVDPTEPSNPGPA